MKEKKKGNRKVVIVVLIISLILIIAAGAIYWFKFGQSLPTNEGASNEPSEEPVKPPVVEKKLQIYQGTDRPIAVMIDNEQGAWPHAGLQDAYMIYEAIIEGGESRMMALFKGKDTAKIGPIRSSRHYFVHYAMENDAIYAHFGWSPKAESTIRNNGVNNINGIYDTYFWREGSGYHNAFSSMEKIKQTATKKGYEQTGSDKPIYKYSAEPIELENGVEITGLKLKYSTLHNVSYEYSEEDKVFYRSMRGKIDKDRVTKEQYYAKNIVVMYVENYTLNDGENKGRQDLDNIGAGNGYYITNGKYIPITWKKDSLKNRTLWLDASGNEIVLNDGLTFVQIIPKNNQVVFTPKEVTPPSETNT